MADDNFEDDFFAPEDYLDMVRSFTNHPSFMELFDKLLERNPTALNLVCEDWEDKLKASPVYRLWQKKIEYKETSKQFFKHVTFNKKFNFKFITACDIRFGRMSKDYPTSWDKVKDKIECFTSSPVAFLTNVLAAQVKKTKYNYMRIFPPKCSPMCSQCNRYKISPGSFCIKSFKYFDGKDKFLLQSSYIDEAVNKNFIGVAVIQITGAVFFNAPEFAKVKLTGNFSEAILTQKSCITAETDDGVMLPILKSQKEEREEEEGVVGNIIENEIENIMYNVPPSIEVEKRKISYSLEDQQQQQLPSKMMRY